MMNAKEQAEFLKSMYKFLRFSAKALNLKSLPKINWTTSTIVPAQHPTFGSFLNDKKVINVSIVNRHPLDIMRTLAHELVHYKQFLNGQLDAHSGDTGSNEENEAHAKAGVIMRHFDRAYPNLFKSSPVAK